MMKFRYWECPKSMQDSLLYDWKHLLYPHGFGGAVKPGEEEDHSVNE